MESRCDFVTMIKLPIVCSLTCASSRRKIRTCQVQVKLDLDHLCNKPVRFTASVGEALPVYSDEDDQDSELIDSIFFLRRDDSL
jgi:hypothetical protein